MFRRVLVGAIVGGVVLVSPAPAAAQNAGLANLLVDLFQAEVRLAPPTTGGTLSHEAHFVPGAQQRLAPYFFNQQLVTQVATIPIGSPAGGFSFTFDPSAGAFRRATESFGPVFAERALTNGEGKLTVGANFQHSNYSSFGGQDLDNGEIKFYLRHEDVPGGDFFFEGDLIEAALNLELRSTTTTPFLNYGVTDRWDVALAIPIVHVSMDAVVDATVSRLATGNNSTIHAFVGGGQSATFRDSGSSTGLGDMVVRTKYRLFDRQGGGIAAGADIRLPTGDAENLLGAGAPAVTFVFITSTSRGRFSPHLNVGYTASGSGDVLLNAPNEFTYRVGTEYTVTPRFTLGGTLLGRSLIDVGRLELTDTPWSYTDASGARRSTTLREYGVQDGSLNLVNLGVGGKANLTRTLLLSANVLISLTSSGVTTRVTPVFGFDYSF